MWTSTTEAAEKRVRTNMALFCLQLISMFLRDYLASDNDIFQIREHFLTRQTPDDLVHKIERRKFVVANLAAAGAPTVGSLRFADPVSLVRSQSVATITDLVSRGIAIRRKARRNDDGVIQGTRQKRGREDSAEVIICVAIDAVHEDEGTSDVLVLRLQWVVAVDEHPRLLPCGLDPFRAV
jgi:hypothetical protein